jgi:hypothetical protein
VKARFIIPLVALTALSALAGRPALGLDAQLTLPDFKSLEARASESVNITLDASLIALASQFLDGSKPEDAAVRKAIGGIKGIYVRSFTFDSDFAYPKEEVEQIRRQLSPPGWQRLVQVHSTKDHNDVDIYVRVDQGKPSGLAIIASEPRQFTIVNIVGAIDLQKLHSLEGSFGIPKLQLDDKK